MLLKDFDVTCMKKVQCRLYNQFKGNLRIYPARHPRLDIGKLILLKYLEHTVDKLILIQFTYKYSVVFGNKYFTMTTKINKTVEK